MSYNSQAKKFSRALGSNYSIISKNAINLIIIEYLKNLGDPIESPESLKLLPPKFSTLINIFNKKLFCTFLHRKIRR